MMCVGYLLEKTSTGKIQTLHQKHWKQKTKKVYWCYVCNSLEEPSCFCLRAVAGCQHGKYLTVGTCDICCLALKFRATSLLAWLTRNHTVHSNPSLWHVNPIEISNNAHRIWTRNVTDIIVGHYQQWKSVEHVRLLGGGKPQAQGAGAEDLILVLYLAQVK